MKINQFLFVFFLALSCTAFAQNELPNIPLALSLQDSEISSDFSDDKVARIASKLSRLFGNTHYLATGDHEFAIYPRVDILEELETEGLRTLQTVKMELSISIRSTRGGISFGTYSWMMTGTASSKKSAMNRALTSLPRSDAKFTSYLEKVQTKMNEYYAANCAAIITRAERNMTMGMYKSAILELVKIPAEMSSCKNTVDEKIEEAYTGYQEKHCGAMLLKARALFAQRKFNEALDALIQISPESNCAAEANVFVTEMQSQVTEERNDKLEFAREIYRENRERRLINEQLRIQRWIGITEIAKATASVAGAFSPSVNIPVYLGKQ